MALLQEWHKIAYNEKADQGELQRFWQKYFLLEKGFRGRGKWCRPPAPGR